VRFSSWVARPAAHNGDRQRRLSDETGSYQAPLLISGTYSVTVDKDGFKKAVQGGVILEANQKARVDVILELGAANETVNVAAA
jgi:hypothetical protein